MKASSGHIVDLWNAGGPFIAGVGAADGAPDVRATVVAGWTLGVHTAAFADFNRTPVRYHTSTTPHTETELPNVLGLTVEESVDQDAATCNLTLQNQKMPAFGDGPNPAGDFGDPGFYTPSRGANPAANTRWGHTSNAWAGVLTEGAFVVTYEGYGGKTKTLAQAVADGNLEKTGTWIVEDVDIDAARNTIALTMRNMAVLLLEPTLMPPLVPATDADGCPGPYPLEYPKYVQLEGSGIDSPGIPYGDSTGSGRYIMGIAYGNAESPCSPLGEGYWLAGSDGGVFTLGYLGYHGSQAGLPLNQPITGIAATETSRGYWLVAEDGGVFASGDAGYFGSVPDDDIAISNAVDIARTPTGDGYVVFGADGGVYTYGDAVYDGSGVGVVSGAVVAGAHHPTGAGYWLVTNTGHVYAFGVAGYFGGIDGAGGVVDVVDIAPSLTGDGYHLLRSDGSVTVFGDAVHHGDVVTEGDGPLNDPAVDLAVHPDGYWIAAADGGVFTYGAGMLFYGSLPGPWVNLTTVATGYTELSDVVREIALWSGFHLEGSATAEVFGNVADTGTFPEEGLPADLFDKQAPIDAINAIRETVGFVLRVDHEGAFVFVEPNWWAPGNYLPDGTHVATIWEADEKIQLTGFRQTRTTEPLRSQVDIVSAFPDDSVTGTKTTTFVPASAAGLRGRVRQLVVPVDVPLDQGELDAMAELIDLHMWMQSRTGQATMWANPCIDVDDQIRFWERQSADADIYYIRSLSRTFDRASGEYTMNVTASWVAADEDDWGIA